MMTMPWQVTVYACREPLPDVDAMFHRYKDTPVKDSPNNSAMASSHNGQLVVRYIKVC
jgi:hypothetical protein